ncbi:MAG: hypothetical protein PW790_00530 [Parvibaculaceae bacterium]|nr:hypothetical protein [Parvibaculaceae bacterium]
MERVKQAKIGIFPCFGKGMERHESGIVKLVRPRMGKTATGKQAILLNACLGR